MDVVGGIRTLERGEQLLTWIFWMHPEPSWDFRFGPSENFLHSQPRQMNLQRAQCDAGQCHNRVQVASSTSIYDYDISRGSPQQACLPPNT